MHGKHHNILYYIHYSHNNTVKNLQNPVTTHNVWPYMSLDDQYIFIVYHQPPHTLPTHTHTFLAEPDEGK